MTIHYATSYWFDNVLVSVDNKTATKVSVWVSAEDTARKSFSGMNAYDEAMNFGMALDEELEGSAEMPNAESVSIALGGATFDDSY